MKRITLFLIILMTLTAGVASARAYDPKCKTGIGDGTGTGTTDGNVKLPIGLPFQLTDQNSGSSDENAAAHPANIVYKFDIPGEIGPEAFRQTKTALAEAKEMNAAYVLIHISSNSGTLDAAENIKNEIQNFDRPVLVYVDNKTIPASELISMAGDSVYLRNGSKGLMNSVSRSKKENSSSAVFSRKDRRRNSSMNSVGSDEQNCLNRNVRTISFFSLTEGAAGTDEVLSHAGLEDFKVVEYKESFVGKLVDWCLRPVAGFFLMIGFSLAVAVQRRSRFPGPATFFLLCTLPFIIYPLYSGGLASYTEFAMLGASTLLLLFSPMKYRFTPLLTLLLFSISLFLARSGAITAHFTSETITLAGTTLLAVVLGWNLPGVLLHLRTRMSSVRLRSVRIAS